MFASCLQVSLSLCRPKGGERFGSGAASLILESNPRLLVRCSTLQGNTWNRIVVRETGVRVVTGVCVCVCGVCAWWNRCALDH